jgi:hypothetical protein
VLGLIDFGLLRECQLIDAIIVSMLELRQMRWKKRYPNLADSVDQVTVPLRGIYGILRYDTFITAILQNMRRMYRVLLNSVAPLLIETGAFWYCRYRRISNMIRSGAVTAPCPSDFATLRYCELYSRFYGTLDLHTTMV